MSAMFLQLFHIPSRVKLGKAERTSAIRSIICNNSHGNKWEKRYADRTQQLRLRNWSLHSGPNIFKAVIYLIEANSAIWNLEELERIMAMKQYLRSTNWNFSGSKQLKKVNLDSDQYLMKLFLMANMNKIFSNHNTINNDILFRLRTFTSCLS